MPQLEQKNQQEVLEISQLTSPNNVWIREGLDSLNAKKELTKNDLKKLEEITAENLFANEENKELLEKIRDNFGTKNDQWEYILDMEHLKIFKEKLSEHSKLSDIVSYDKETPLSTAYTKGFISNSWIEFPAEKAFFYEWGFITVDWMWGSYGDFE